MASLQRATVVALHGLTTISCHVGVDILYRDYNARERYGAPAGSWTSHLRLMPTMQVGADGSSLRSWLEMDICALVSGKPRVNQTNDNSDGAQR